MRSDLDSVVQYVHKKTASYDGSHDTEHAKRVAHNACRMGALKKDVHWLAVVGALVHDTCDKKYVIDKESALIELHFFLKGFMSEEDAHTIVDAVREVSFSVLRKRGPPFHLNKRAFLVWRIVSDADMLEAMGLVGVVRTLMFQGSVTKPLDAAIEYAVVHLVQCIDFMENSIAILEAKRRLATMQEVLTKMKDPNTPERHLGHFCISAGCRRWEFNSTIGKMRTKRFWNDALDAAFRRETEWSAKACRFGMSTRLVRQDRPQAHEEAMLL